MTFWFPHHHMFLKTFKMLKKCLKHKNKFDMKTSFSKPQHEVWSCLQMARNSLVIITGKIFLFRSHYHWVNTTYSHVIFTGSTPFILMSLSHEKKHLFSCHYHWGNFFYSQVIITGSTPPILMSLSLGEHDLFSCHNHYVNTICSHAITTGWTPYILLSVDEHHLMSFLVIITVWTFYSHVIIVENLFRENGHLQLTKRSPYSSLHNYYVIYPTYFRINMIDFKVIVKIGSPYVWATKDYENNIGLN